MKEIFILSGARTPFATWASGTRGDGEKGGRLKGMDPFDLGAAALKGALAKAGLGPSSLDVSVFSLMYAVGPHACYGGRYVSHRAGLPETTPSLTVSLACGSGLYALMAAAREVETGARLAAAGGADNASLVRRDVFIPSFKDISCGLHIAQTAQTLAAEASVSREEQDRWSLQSHRRARRAQEFGLLAEEIVEAGGLSEDDHVLREPSAKHFADSEMLFEEGAATRANTHGIVDGASALVLASAEALPPQAAPLGRYLGGAVVGLDPRHMALASVLAIRKALERTGLGLKDIDLFEINETFAAQVLLNLKELGLAEDKVNVNGGALALGHPFAGTGCRQVLTLLKELGRRGLRRGAAAICVGGGQGIAVVVERA